MNEKLNNFKKSKNGRIFLSHIISMLKGIHFIDKAKTTDDLNKQIDDGFVSSTNYGINISLRQYLSINAGWRRRSLEFLETIADKFILYFEELSNGDRDTYCKTIRSTVENSLLDVSVFDISKQNSQNETFFSILSADNPIKPTENLLDLIYLELLNSLADWLIIFPMERIKSNSYTILYDGITLLDPDDNIIWEQLAPNFKRAASWHPSPETKNSKWDALDSTWLVCQSNGTANGVRKFSERKMRTFISVLFSFLYPIQNILDKSSARETTYSIQFPSINSFVRETGINASIGNILPPLLSNIEITGKNLQDVSNWYKKRATLSVERQKRITTASQFLNYAIVTDGIDRFIHFFIVLDALFGKRGDVERLITEGVKSVFPENPMWNYKMSKLFDLRSELVHGGCSSINEWKDFDSYRNHTKSHPDRDVAEAAILSFKNIQILANAVGNTLV